MSRSYKHSNYCTDGSPKTTKENKRIAAGRIRNIDPESEEADILAGKSARYKKIHKDTYDIHDYKFFYTEAEARKYYQEMQLEEVNDIVNVSRKKFFEKYPTEDIYIEKGWAKDFKRK
jgi:hypothetical protein